MIMVIGPNKRYVEAQAKAAAKEARSRAGGGGGRVAASRERSGRAEPPHRQRRIGSHAEDEEPQRHRQALRVTRKGKVLHRKTTGNHMLTKKSGGQRRRVEGMAEVSAEKAKIKRLLGKA